MSSTGASLHFIPATATGNGGNWLSVTAPCYNCSTPATFSVNVNGSKLPAGVYFGQTTLTGDASTVVPYSLVVVGPVGPANLLSTAPSSLNFTYRLGAGAVPLQILSVNSSGSAIAYATAVTSQSSWLQVSNGTGTTPGYVAVSVNPAGLAIGTYNGSLQVTSQFSSPVTIPVSLAVTSNVLSLSQTQLNFSYQSGANLPPPQIVTVTSTGSGLNYAASITSGGNWLNVSNGVGATPGSVQISVNPSALGSGTYTGTIQFTAASSPAINLPVTLSIVGTNSLTVGGTRFGFAFTGGGTQVVAVGSSGPALHSPVPRRPREVATGLPSRRRAE